MPSGAGNPDAPSRAGAYCRAARRIRGRWSDRPGRLHRELRDLAARHDADRLAPPPLGHGTCGTFAREVVRRLEGPVLRHAERRRLLASARRMGIGRFEANLIIAAVQHGRRPEVTSQAPQSRRRWGLTPIALVIGTEMAIAWGAWLVFHA
jgi:hypothetical protein